MKACTQICFKGLNDNSITTRNNKIINIDPRMDASYDLWGQFLPQDIYFLYVFDKKKILPHTKIGIIPINNLFLKWM